MSNLQSIFDQVVSHLRQQGRKARAQPTSSCAYRTNEGLKCAAGCLIPDEDYRPEFEGANLFDGHRSVAKYFQTRYNEKEYSLIKNLQCIHDQTDVAHWERRWKELANNYNLKFVPL